MKKLLSYDNDLEMVEDCGLTPLFLAVDHRGGFTYTIRTMIKAGANLYVVDDNARILLELLWEKHWEDEAFEELSPLMDAGRYLNALELQKTRASNIGQDGEEEEEEEEEARLEQKEEEERQHAAKARIMTWFEVHKRDDTHLVLMLKRFAIRQSGK